MKRSLGGIAVTAVAVLLFVGMGDAVEEQILVKAQVICATGGEMIKEAMPMDENDPLYAPLKKLFRFKNYGIITTGITNVLSGRHAQLALKGTMFLDLEPEITEEGSIRLAISWGEKHYNREERKAYVDPFLRTTIVSASGATTILGGKQEQFVERENGKPAVVKKGALILAITPTIVGGEQ